MSQLYLAVDNTAPPEDSPYQEYRRVERRRFWVGFAWRASFTLLILIGIFAIGKL